MHDLKWIEAHSEKAKALLARRGLANSLHELDEIIALFKKRRALIVASDDLKKERNIINNLLKTASSSEIEERRQEMRELSSAIKNSDQELDIVEVKLNNLSLLIPNFPREDVPLGKDEHDNVVVKEVLTKRDFDFPVRDHIELGILTDTIDMARAAKISGSRFAFLKGAGAKLSRALMQFFCNYHVGLGDCELNPPLMVREQAMVGTGNFPKFVDEAFKVASHTNEPYYLIPTAEVPLTNYLADEIIDEASLPLRFCAYSACFRAEAGAAGKDTRGLVRLHQFEKVEMVRFAKASQAEAELDLMVNRASDLLSMLELPHRIVSLCCADLGFHSEKTLDLEVFLPAQNTFREISSCSSFGSFQARRAKIRMRSSQGDIEPLVTLNGSGLPLGRTLVAIYENYQQADGSIIIPKVLRDFMGQEKITLSAK
jgi:seryl-tRNA synthetase